MRGFMTHIALNIDRNDEGLSNYELNVFPLECKKVEERMFGFHPTFESYNKNLL